VLSARRNFSWENAAVGPAFVIYTTDNDAAGGRDGHKRQWGKSGDGELGPRPTQEQRDHQMSEESSLAQKMGGQFGRGEE